MDFEWQVAPVSDWLADAVLFYFFEDSREALPGFERWAHERGSALFYSKALEDFKAKPRQVEVFYNPSDFTMPRLVCAGLGPAEKFDLDVLRNATASAFRKCREIQLPRPALPLAALDGLPLDRKTALQEALVGGLSGLYQYQGLKTRDREPLRYPEVIHLLAESEPGADLRGVPPAADAIISGISLARDLVAAPSNQVTPSFLARTAERIANAYGFKLRVIDLEEARSLGMGAFAAVAQGSREPARMIILEYAPTGFEDEMPIVLVGKGITFDTGGISLKPSDKMDAMKQDMAGAAAVLGTFEVLGRMKIGRRVVGILPCTENMPGGQAYKPGDVVRTLSGLTVEIISTDAEGRVVLCDAISYAERYHPALIVDIATLTGACIIALGHQAAAVMGNREDLVQEIQKIGMQVGERFWPLPLWDFYFENIKSDVADFKNVGERTAGTIVGGIFLKQFVPEKTPWAHLDIAGTAWSSKDLGAVPQGATGFGVRTMVELARRWPELKIR